MVRQQVERHVDSELGDVKVHRSSETSTAAKQLSARAYTTGGEIHVPPDQGPLDREPGRSLVAHELVHVAQQRQLGASLPTEESHHGQELESQAQRVEVSTQQSDSPLVLARKPDAESIAQNAAQLAVQRVTSETPRAAEVQTASAQWVQRAEVAPPSSSSSAPPATSSSSGGGGSEGGGGNAPDPLSGLPSDASHQEGAALQENQLRQAWTYVRSRLGEELTDDRERAGRIIDLF